MNLIFLFLILFLPIPITINGAEKEGNSYIEVMSIIKEYSSIMREKDNIELRGYGLHYAGKDKVYDGKIHEINLSYSINKKNKFEDARKLFYSLVDGLLEKLNKNESVKRYFYHYPVSYQDLYFRLNFDYDRKASLNQGDISMIAILENEIMYFIVEEDGGNAEMETREIVPDVYISSGLSLKTRCITKKLPEEDR